MRQQLAGLADDQRKVVDVLAVFGDPAPFKVLESVSELDDARLLTALLPGCRQADGRADEPADGGG